MTIDGNISTNWARGRRLYEGGSSDDSNVGSETSLEQSFVVHKDSPGLENKLQALIESQDNSDQLHQELKELAMEWFWNGYYKGFSHNKEATQSTDLNK
ncbi:hypothetical protein CANTEDRAFT_119969 [Yamadazyma tenuis ATCC 10573]|uniref:Uncharacterized protein n=1 Tax=Candida tenuis (strain ATCC 10573 / BCRC 21748 / CBS 615 / JCM 9827 / NBRC 10315 / NRRL Y-1498 / VKM Y-70) TaxID=590646 RepID=G3B1L7_CANTC|nr:uncharacterized protein CANTEDRAFT_119969 [Yamadazyma tenuis ATCC 10573]EGV64476.1 hypothetical protein CANTEDRAFT_119969 [Yamadazyma tenuis ATCC 10573]